MAAGGAGVTTRGFLLGKFMPVHAGHLFLIDVARHHVARLTVLLCSHDAEPIDGKLRAEWMRRCLPGDVRLIHMHRDIPQEPGDHPDFWAIWRAAIREHHPEPIDTVFGSEPYVMRLAETLGASPFPVDIPRATVPVSASAIRADPAAHWAHVPGPVRPHFQRRVCLMGPESTGKSTLAATLAADLGGPHIPEHGRDYDATFRQGAAWSAADFIELARRHAALAAAIAERAGPVVIEDTDLLQTMVWAKHLLGHVPDALAARLDTFCPADLYLLLSPDVPWHDDGTRYFGAEAARRRFHDDCEALLAQVGAKVRHITGSDWNVRAETARLSLLGQSTPGGTGGWPPVPSRATRPA